MSWVALGRIGLFVASAGGIGAIAAMMGCNQKGEAKGERLPKPDSIRPANEEFQQTTTNGCSRFDSVVEHIVPNPEKHLDILLKYAQKYATRPQASSATYDADLAGIRAALIALPGGVIYFQSSDPTQIHNNILDGFNFLNKLATVQPSRLCTESDYTVDNRTRTEEAIACNIKHYWGKGLSVMMRGYYLSKEEFRIITPENQTQFPEIGKCEKKISNKIFPLVSS